MKEHRKFVRETKKILSSKQTMKKKKVKDTHIKTESNEEEPHVLDAVATHRGNLRRRCTSKLRNDSDIYVYE